MSIIIMILLLSVLILVHEAGHFLAAKMFKMKVARFGFGLPIGPTLWEKQVGDVKVLVHAFLLGGYVAFPDDDKELNLPADSPDRFMNRPIYQRLVVVSAGVFANVVCAFVLVFLTAALWGHMPSGKYDIFVKDIVAPKEASIWQSGLQKGDKILKINGINVTTTAAPILIAQLSKEDDGKVDKDLVNKNLEKLRKLNQTFEEDEIIPKDVLIKLPSPEYEKAVILSDKVLKGLKKYNDPEVKLSEKQIKIREKIDDKNYIISDGTLTLNDLSYAVSDNVHPINMEVLRNGNILELKPIYPNKDGLMGIQMEIKEIVIPTKGPKAIIKTSINYLWEQTSMLLYGLYQIFTGKIPLKDLHGIVAITKVGGDIIEHNGFFSGLLLTAIISLDLAIVNFLPIPALDGGHVMFLLIEKLRGKPLNEETIDKIGTAGFLLLIALMILVVFNDIYALLTQKL
ncbi:TPA: RIP metalloprotease RseP [Candidatus Scatousia excrementigallinarum]|uniref:Zinc metalloprotease n=1 Tax=Candidatus Scatousia excrementigallinarum TaxID=2840935 RepID=A0A9D1F1F7_9BACT|nr:RIP metalloprotease RseP [Candidatus Scatousia excrementigallinarum]